MNTTLRNTLACLAWSLPLATFAQTTPAPASSTGMDMMDMPGMTHRHAAPAKHSAHAGHGMRKPAKPAAHAMHGHAVKPADATGQAALPMPMPDMQQAMPAATMPAMDHADHAAGATPAMSHADHADDAMPGMDHMEMPPPADHVGMDHGDAHVMHDMRMQGGAAPADARSADYSDGLAYGDMAGMDMRDAEPLGLLRFDQLEAFHGSHGNGQAWELQGWYGTDNDKLWLRSEGERESGRLGEGDVEALWSHAASAYWDTQLGVRHDFGGGPARQWLAFGVQGLAPYWFELQATAYAGPAGRTAARLRVDYELLLTQRLILQPEAEVNFYGKADPARRIGSGLSDASFGLRLRYEIRRQFAPYLGVVWTRRFGGTADFAHAEHQPVFDRRIVAGLRIGF